MSAAFFFYAVSEENNPAYIGVVMRNIASGQQAVINTTWQINLTMGTYTLEVVANPDGIIDDKDRHQRPGGR